ncbi:MAG: hypothetical protein DRH43_00225 [Deltaproteobacteria bacterium]|nr:MAG: hypothetical protein DRH43_00225 [Deltaproteobacteria bacterium]
MFSSLLDSVEEGIPYGRMHNFPQVFGLYADINYENKNPGPERGIEKLIGPKTQNKQRARTPETKPNFKEE